MINIRSSIILVAMTLWYPTLWVGSWCWDPTDTEKQDYTHTHTLPLGMCVCVADLPGGWEVSLPHLTPKTTWLKVFMPDLLTSCSRHLPAGEMKLPESYNELWVTPTHPPPPPPHSAPLIIPEPITERSDSLVSVQRLQTTSTLIKSRTGFTLKTFSDVLDTLTSPGKQSVTTRTGRGHLRLSKTLLVPDRKQKKSNWKSRTDTEEHLNGSA